MIFNIRGLTVIFFCLVSNAHAQLVLRGDYPDPSVAKIGNLYWASATTSNWAPAYPLLSSPDLETWEARGSVFPTLPSWADYYFWAPEISYDNGRVYIYYSAHQKGGNLCLGVASADKPEGPYEDHGPLMCQQVGSIDAFPMRDENGKLHLIWKEDGNSVGKPTPIWISEMAEDRKSLIGEKKELFRNDAKWESNLVEGVSMIRRGDYFYAFYAAAGCCGLDCTYATGIARAKNLLGPWEKFPGNPILGNDEEWKCPGHGTPVEYNGKFYFLYHAYHKDGSVYAGRQGLLKEFEFTTDGWIRFLPTEFGNKKQENIRDEFEDNSPGAFWQWSVFQPPVFEIGNGRLNLHPADTNGLAYLGHKTFQADYRVRTRIDLTASDAVAGLGAIGDEKNIVAASVDKNKIRIWKKRLGKDTLIMEENITPHESVVLEMRVDDGKRISFRCSTNGRAFKTINRKPIDGSFLPPWDRAIRIGLISEGRRDQKAVFENFILYH